MIKQLMVAGCVLVSLVGSAAFDADTIAFYAFNDKGAGTRYDAATTDIVTNSVNGSLYSGAINIYRYSGVAGSYGSLTFEDDVPGRYVYSDWAATNLLAEVQSVHMMSNGAASTKDRVRTYSGATISIDGIADALSGQTQYTIEFFYKCAEVAASQFALTYFTTTNNYIYVPYGDDRVGISQGIENNTDSRMYVTYSTAMNDGQWHHMAIVRNGDSLFLYADYTLKKETLDVLTGGDVESGRVFTLGGDAFIADENNPGVKSLKNAYLCALRVSLSARTPETFLAALPHKPVDSFHWSFSEADSGSAAGQVVLNNYSSVDYAQAKSNAYWLANSTSPITAYDPLVNWLGNGTVSLASKAAAGGGDVTWVNDATSPRTRLLSGDTDVSRGNLRSLNFSTVGDTSVANYGLSWGGAVRSAGICGANGLSAFTFEGFFKLDYEMWSNNVVAVQLDNDISRYRTMLFGLSSSASDSEVFRVIIQSDSDLASAGRIYFQVGVGSKSYSLKQGSSTYKVNARTWASVWHHIAVTYDPVSSPLSLTVWIDRTAYSVELDDQLEIENAKAWICANGNSINAFPGDMDEIRFTPGVLAKSKFLRMSLPDCGFVVIIR